MLDSDAESAKTLTFVAIILQVVFTGIIVFIVMLVLPISVAVNTPGISPNPGMFGLGIALVILGVFTTIGLIWILLDYFLIYSPLSRGEVERAETPALVLSIIQIIFGGVIPGILLIVAWVKIKDSIRRKERMGAQAT